MGFRIYHLKFDPDPYVSTVHRQVEAACPMGDGFYKHNRR